MRATALLALAACWTQPPPPTRRAPPPTKLDPFHDLAITEAACHAHAAARVSRDGALADLAIVERVIRRGYVGFDRHDDGAWTAAFGALRARITHHGAFTGDDLAALFASGLALAADPELTFTATTPRAAQVRRDVYTVDLALERRGADYWVTAADNPTFIGQRVRCADATMVPVLADVSHPIARPVVRTIAPTPLSCQLIPTQELPMRRLLAPPPEPVRSARAAFELAYHAGIPVLRVRSFALDADTRGRLLAALALAAHGPAYVVDLRGNPGVGDPDLARELVRVAMDHPLRESGREVITSEVTLQGELAAATCAAADTEALRARLETAALAPPKRELASVEASAQPIVTSPGAAVPILIVDGACRGACEHAVYYARQHDRAVVIGEPTAGADAHDALLAYRLPASGIQLSAPTRRAVAPEITAALGAGYDPDLYVDSANLDTALAPILACARQPSCIASLRP